MIRSILINIYHHDDTYSPPSTCWCLNKPYTNCLREKSPDEIVIRNMSPWRPDCRTLKRKMSFKSDAFELLPFPSFLPLTNKKKILDNTRTASTLTFIRPVTINTVACYYQKNASTLQSRARHCFLLHKNSRSRVKPAAQFGQEPFVIHGIANWQSHVIHPLLGLPPRRLRC